MSQSLFTQVGAADFLAGYLIRVQGEVDASWLEYFNGISIIISEPHGKPVMSTICAHDSDQAAILGILNSLYNSGFPILYLERLGTDFRNYSDSVVAV